MLDQTLPVTADGTGARPVHAVRPPALAAFLAGLPTPQADFLRGCGFTARAGEFFLLPGDGGVVAAVLGLGEDTSPHGFGGMASRLPEGNWTITGENIDSEAAVLGFCLGAYRFAAFKTPSGPRPLVVAGPGHAAALSQAAAAWMVRDLINMPANRLGPAELAGLAADLGTRHGATVTRCTGAALEAAYPAVAAVGAGSDRPAEVVTFHWQGSAATAGSRLISLCGKGVCFDSGGYDLKPSAGMLRMKKDMGGAAIVLGIARLIMEADLPIRLAVRVGCVENSVSGRAFRPMDVLRTRRGLAVEVGNTDAEGRLVLCDLLAEASDEAPALLLDCATLTGAARVALGPDLPALFCTDEAWAAALLAAGTEMADPLWRLPLWDGYDSWLDSPIADLNNVGSKPLAGAITAALFMRRFLAAGTAWAHLDVYAWNDATRPGRPEGGEAQAMRAVFAAVAAYGQHLTTN